MDKRNGMVGGICVCYWERYRCDHGEPLGGICGCNDPDSGRQHNFTTNPYRTNLVVEKPPYTCSECTRLDVDALYCGSGERLVEVFDVANALLGKHRRGKRLPELRTWHHETAGSATENPGLGTPMGAQHQPSQKRHRSPESEAPPQRKSLRRSSGSVDLRAEAQRQSSSSHSESSGNLPSGNEVAISAGYTVSNGAPGGHRPRNHRHVPNNADRLSTIQEWPHNEGSPLPNKNYWALQGGPDKLGPLNITNPSLAASPHRTQDPVKNGGLRPRMIHWTETDTAEQQQGYLPVRSVNHEAAKPCAGDPQPRIPPREYVAVKSDNPLLSSPKPPRKNPAARSDNSAPSSSKPPVPFSGGSRPEIPATEYTAVRPDDPRLSSPKPHRKNPATKHDGPRLSLPRPPRVYTAVGADNPLLSSPKPLPSGSRQP